MKAIIALNYRDNESLLTGAKLVTAKTKKDIKITARNLAIQMSMRLSDIIFDDSPYWQDYLANTEKANLWM